MCMIESVSPVPSILCLLSILEKGQGPLSMLFQPGQSGV